MRSIMRRSMPTIRWLALALAGCCLLLGPMGFHAGSDPSDLLRLTPLSRGYLQIEFDTDGDGRADYWSVYAIVWEGPTRGSDQELEDRATREGLALIAVKRAQQSCRPAMPELTTCGSVRYLYAVRPEPIKNCLSLPCEAMD